MLDEPAYKLLNPRKHKGGATTYNHIIVTGVGDDLRLHYIQPQWPLQKDSRRTMVGLVAGVGNLCLRFEDSTLSK